MNLWTRLSHELYYLFYNRNTREGVHLVHKDTKNARRVKCVDISIADFKFERSLDLVWFGFDHQ